MSSYSSVSTRNILCSFLIEFIHRILVLIVYITVENVIVCFYASVNVVIYSNIIHKVLFVCLYKQWTHNTNPLMCWKTNHTRKASGVIKTQWKQYALKVILLCLNCQQIFIVSVNTTLKRTQYFTYNCLGV